MSIHAIFDFTLPSLYTMALLSSLNARQAWNNPTSKNVIDFIDIIGPDSPHRAVASNTEDGLRDAIEMDMVCLHFCNWSISELN